MSKYMKKINILFLSVGNRVELIKEFKLAKKKLDLNGDIHAIDLDETAPALFFADKISKIAPIGGKEYLRDLKRYCIKNRISLIIPLIEKELEVLCEFKEEIEAETKSKILISSREVVEIARDKYKTYKFLMDNGFNTPKIIEEKYIEKNDYNFPLFIKPFNGSGSINNFKIKTKKELMFFKDYVKEPIIQEFIDGTEYCVDIFSDFEGKAITIVPKIRLKHESGTIIKAKVVKDKEIIDEMRKIVDILRPVGEINIDCIKSNGKIYIIEINARFSGGPLVSFKAGANSAENIYKLLIGEKLNYTEEYKENIMVISYKNSIVI